MDFMLLKIIEIEVVMAEYKVVSFLTPGGDFKTALISAKLFDDETELTLADYLPPCAVDTKIKEHGTVMIEGDGVLMLDSSYVSE